MAALPQHRGILTVQTPAQGECLETAVKLFAILGSFDCDERFYESLASPQDDRVKVRSKDESDNTSNPLSFGHDENPRPSKTGSD
jgi:hypothetical protein